MAGRTRHTSLTDAAGKVVKALRAAGYRPHPGRISARGGKGAVRLKVSGDSSRTRIRVAGGGVQELLLYGDVELDHLLTVLRQTVGPDAIEQVDGRARPQPD